MTRHFYVPKGGEKKKYSIFNHHARFRGSRAQFTWHPKMTHCAGMNISHKDPLCVKSSRFSVVLGLHNTLIINFFLRKKKKNFYNICEDPLFYGSTEMITLSRNMKRCLFISFHARSTSVINRRKSHFAPSIKTTLHKKKGYLAITNLPPPVGCS